jgi:hypothetical protein
LAYAFPLLPEGRHTPCYGAFSGGGRVTKYATHILFWSLPKGKHHGRVVLRDGSEEMRPPYKITLWLNLNLLSKNALAHTARMWYYDKHEARGKKADLSSKAASQV